jgi:hypothetical protein
MTPYGKTIEIGTSEDTQTMALGWTVEELDVNNTDRGIQVFKYFKLIGENSVAISVGSPVGEKQAAGGGTLTADQSSAGSAGICHGRGGLAQFAVTATGTKFGFVQTGGLNRVAAKIGSGTVSAGAHVIWSGDDTLNDVGASDEEDIFARALVAGASNAVAIAGLALGDV